MTNVDHSNKFVTLTKKAIVECKHGKRSSLGSLLPAHWPECSAACTLVDLLSSDGSPYVLENCEEDANYFQIIDSETGIGDTRKYAELRIKLGFQECVLRICICV